jgi:hypothetical protein
MKGLLLFSAAIAGIALAPVRSDAQACLADCVTLYGGSDNHVIGHGCVVGDTYADCVVVMEDCLT